MLVKSSVIIHSYPPPFWRWAKIQLSIWMILQLSMTEVIVTQTGYLQNNSAYPGSKLSVTETVTVTGMLICSYI